MSISGTGRRLDLAVRALSSFVAAFAIARVFTTLYPEIIIIHGGFHLHHFWFGIASVVIGGWMLFARKGERAKGLAATLFGAGGGLIGDEIGLLAFGDYQAAITYTVIIWFTASVSLVILIARYFRVISGGLRQFVGKDASLYVGVFLIAASFAFIEETNDLFLTLVAVSLTVTGVCMLSGYIWQKFKSER